MDEKDKKELSPEFPKVSDAIKTFLLLYNSSPTYTSLPTEKDLAKRINQLTTAYLRVLECCQDYGLIAKQKLKISTLSDVETYFQQLSKALKSPSKFKLLDEIERITNGFITYRSTLQYNCAKLDWFSPARPIPDTTTATGAVIISIFSQITAIRELYVKSIDSFSSPQELGKKLKSLKKNLAEFKKSYYDLLITCASGNLLHTTKHPETARFKDITSLEIADFLFTFKKTPISTHKDLDNVLMHISDSYFLLIERVERLEIEVEKQAKIKNPMEPITQICSIISSDLESLKEKEGELTDQKEKKQKKNINPMLVENIRCLLVLCQQQVFPKLNFFQKIPFLDVRIADILRNHVTHWLEENTTQLADLEKLTIYTMHEHIKLILEGYLSLFPSMTIQLPTILSPTGDPSLRDDTDYEEQATQFALSLGIIRKILPKIMEESSTEIHFDSLTKWNKHLDELLSNCTACNIGMLKILQDKFESYFEYGIQESEHTQNHKYLSLNNFLIPFHKVIQNYYDKLIITCCEKEIQLPKTIFITGFYEYLKKEPTQKLLRKSEQAATLGKIFVTLTDLMRPLESSIDYLCTRFVKIISTQGNELFGSLETDISTSLFGQKDVIITEALKRAMFLNKGEIAFTLLDHMLERYCRRANAEQIASSSSSSSSSSSFSSSSMLSTSMPVYSTIACSSALQRLETFKIAIVTHVKASSVSNETAKEILSFLSLSKSVSLSLGEEKHKPDSSDRPLIRRGSKAEFFHNSSSNQSSSSGSNPGSISSSSNSISSDLISTTINSDSSSNTNSSTV